MELFLKGQGSHDLDIRLRAQRAYQRSMCIRTKRLKPINYSILFYPTQYVYLDLLFCLLGVSVMS